jgi:hypothetical protein
MQGMKQRVTFTAQQIDSLRHALSEYLVLTHADSESAWLAVTEEICVVTPSARSNRNLNPQALRRFSEGQAVLLPVTLVELKDFLICKNVLDPLVFPRRPR